MSALLHTMNVMNMPEMTEAIFCNVRNNHSSLLMCTSYKSQYTIFFSSLVTCFLLSSIHLCLFLLHFYSKTDNPEQNTNIAILVYGNTPLKGRLITFNWVFETDLCKCSRLTSRPRPYMSWIPTPTMRTHKKKSMSAQTELILLSDRYTPPLCLTYAASTYL